MQRREHDGCRHAAGEQLLERVAEWEEDCVLVGCVLVGWAVQAGVVAGSAWEQRGQAAVGVEVEQQVWVAVKGGGEFLRPELRTGPAWRPDLESSRGWLIIFQLHDEPDRGEVVAAHVGGVDLAHMA